MARGLTAVATPARGPGPAWASVPGPAGAGVDVEDAEAIVLEAAHALFAQQEPADHGGVGRNAEIDGIAAQMVGVRRAADPRVVRLAAAGRIDAHGAKQRRHLG